METTKTFKKTAKQVEAIRLMTQYTEVLLEGGSRSGKTFISIYAIIARAIKHPGTRHLVLRKHFNHIKNSIWFQTLPDVMKTAFPDLKVKQNKSEWYYEFTNSSTIWIGGTDDRERIEKLLGSEWDSIYINEASQISYDTYDTIKTRLNPSAGVKPLLLIDYNPPSMSHWGYQIFHKGISPENGQPVNSGRYAMIKMNPADNRENLSAGYIETLESMSESKQRRFLYGEYSDDSEGAIFKREWITNNRVEPEDRKYRRVVVAIDPAVTGNDTSDSTGIVVCAEDKGEFYVLEDATYHGSVTGWANIATRLYEIYQADAIVAEVNNGGDLVEANLRTHNRLMRYVPVRASRGKHVRAEPIADLYERGKVHHVGTHQELEDQMCTWSPDAGQQSPDNMDALVWGLTHLAGKNVGKTQAVSGW